MKNNVLRIVALTLICTLIPISCFAEIDHELIKKNMEKWHYTQFDKGTGTKDDPYIIDEVEDIEFMAEEVFRGEYSYPGRYFLLVNDLYFNDINLPIKDWKGYFPIGWDKIAFEGHFDGGNHTIYGYKALRVDYNDRTGFFGRINNGSVKNLTLSDSYFSSGISAGTYTAVIVNSLSCNGESASIENCHVVNPRGNISRIATRLYANGGTLTVKDCTVEQSDEFMIREVDSINDAEIIISGLVRNPKTQIDENGNEQKVLSNEGIIYYVYSALEPNRDGTVLIENCTNNTPVVGSGSAGFSSVDREDYSSIAVGGILDCSNKKTNSVTIRNCVNNGNIYGVGGAGGIVGVLTHGKIENCVNNAIVDGLEARVGGIVGQHTAGDITGCVNYGDVQISDSFILVGVIRFGGIAGVNNGTIESCVNYGNILGSEMGSGSLEIGGIVGRGSYIYNCANFGELIRITAACGGIAGSVGMNVPKAVVDNCYNMGNVSGSPNNSGSVIGISQRPTLNCYYLAGTHQFGRYTDKNEEGFDHPDYKALSYDEMTKPESFVGFDFANKWIMPSEKAFPIPRGSFFGDVAIPKETEIALNGKSTKLSGYNINGNNYYKIRDIAYLLNGTKNNFSVDWNAEEGIIVIKTKTPYTPVGNENSLNDKNDRAVYQNTEKAMLNNKMIELKAYKIDGSNYFTIREVADIIGFKVDWNEKESKIIIVA